MANKSEKQAYEDEIQQFRRISLTTKEKCLSAYLLGNTQGNNMNDIGSEVFGSNAYGQTVSMILRHYGFHAEDYGNNSRSSYIGYYSKHNGNFKIRTGIDVTEDDIKAFAKKYKNGVKLDDKPFEDFVIARHAKDTMSKHDNIDSFEYADRQYKTDKVDILIALVICALFVLSIITGWCKNHIVITVVLGIFSVVSVSETIRGLRN